MSGKLKKSVLVIEDVEDIRSSYIRGLRRAGFDVDGASSKREAIQWIDQKTFDVAIIDLNLMDSRSDIADRSGIDIIKYIKDLGEGTGCLVISAQKDIDSGLGAFRAGTDEYIKKTEIRSVSDVVDAVETLAERVHINFFGPYKDLIAYLCRPDERTSWETNMMSTIGVNAPKFFEILSVGFSGLLPVIRPIDHLSSLVGDRNSGEIRGIFWSKKKACACEVCFSKSPTENKESDGLLVSKQKFGVHIRVTRIPACDRTKFESRIVMK